MRLATFHRIRPQQIDTVASSGMIVRDWRDGRD